MGSKYSVLMSVCASDNPAWLDDAVKSMLAQVLPPEEFMIVEDGPLTSELNAVIARYEQVRSDIFRIVRIPENRGLGFALATGVLECRNELIARMDSDDFSDPARCQTILSKMDQCPSLALVGCNVDEFTGSCQNVVASVRLPTEPDNAYTFAKRKIPIRHSSIIFRKSAILDVGNYEDLRRSQDYDLVVRLLVKGYQVANVPEVLHYMRVDEDFYRRRGGFDRAKLLARQRYQFYRYGFYGRFEWMVYATAHVVVCLMPNSMRSFFYQHFLRTQPVSQKSESTYEY